MEERTFQLLMDRLERIEQQNDHQLEALHEHHLYVDDARNAVLEQVSVLQEQVDRHKVYFDLLGWIGAPAVTGALGYLFTKLGLR